MTNNKGIFKTIVKIGKKDRCINEQQMTLTYHNPRPTLHTYPIFTNIKKLNYKRREPIRNHETESIKTIQKLDNSAIF